MPGICGFVETSSPSSGTLLDAMVDSLRHQPWHRGEQYCDAQAGVAMGRASLGILNTAEQPARHRKSGSLAVLDGELGLRKISAATGDDASTLLKQYREIGQTCVQNANGKFAAAIWDGDARWLILTNDAFGMKPLYYCQVPGGLLFASEIKALLLDPRVPRTRNSRGIAQFFSFGHLWCNDTLFEAIHVLPAGAWLTYDADEDRLTVGRYRRFAARIAADVDPQELLDRVDASFKAAVDARVDDTPNLGLSLSGGLDARTILGVMDCKKTPVTSVCMGIEGSLDHRSATELAALAGCEHHSYTLNDQFLSRFEEHLRHMVRLTDGHYLSQCIVMPTLPFYRDLDIRVLMRGHGGELLHMQKAYNFSLDAEGLAIRDEAGLQSWMWRHLRSYMLDGVDTPLFADIEAGEIDDLARDSLTEALRESADWEPALQRACHLFITQRLRRETAMSLVKIGNYVETRLPYVDADFVDTLLTLPMNLKLEETLQAHILKKRFPQFLNVTNVNTGARIGASPLMKKILYYRMRILAKLGVKGYQPYERLGLWLRRELRPLVQSILLSDRCLERGLFRADSVRRIVENHFQNQRNHTFLLMVMMICELGQQMFVDGDGHLATTAQTVESHV